MTVEDRTRGSDRREFLRRSAGFATAAGGVGLVVPKALGGGVKRGGVLRFAFSETGAADSLDPATHFALGASGPAVASVYDKLTRSDFRWNVSPRLAVRWDVSHDLKTWTFK